MQDVNAVRTTFVLSCDMPEIAGWLSDSYFTSSFHDAGVGMSFFSIGLACLVVDDEATVIDLQTSKQKNGSQ